MNKNLDLLREALSLDASTTLVELQRAPVPSDVQEARGGQALLALDSLLARNPVFDGIPAPDALRAEVSRLSAHPAVICVESEQPVLPALGAYLVEPEGAVVLDGREQPAAALVVVEGEEYLIIAEPQGARYLRVDGPPLRGGWQGEAPDLGDPPSVDEVLAGWPTADWLRERAQALQGSPLPLDRVAALGTIRRLWLPEGREAQLEVLRTGKRGPADTVTAWARSLDPRQRDTLERLIRVQADQLQRRLEDLTEQPVEPEAERVVALELADRRDALEAAVAVLALGGVPHHVLSLLRDLDREAAELWTQLPAGGILADLDWLGAVAAGAPDAWWAAFALE